jgi:hypothetical protein
MCVCTPNNIKNIIVNALSLLYHESDVFELNNNSIKNIAAFVSACEAMDYTRGFIYSILNNESIIAAPAGYDKSAKIDLAVKFLCMDFHFIKNNKNSSSRKEKISYFRGEVSSWADHPGHIDYDDVGLVIEFLTHHPLT